MDRYAPTHGAGFTLIELVIIVALIGILATLAMGQYSQYVDKARGNEAMAEIAEMSIEIERYRTMRGGALPDGLADIGKAQALDPWQGAYYYINLINQKGNGNARKDRKLNPLNSDYDLFSAGKDGVYKAQISNKDSLDDIIRARDGAYLGRASEF